MWLTVCSWISRSQRRSSASSSRRWGMRTIGSRKRERSGRRVIGRTRGTAGMRSRAFYNSAVTPPLPLSPATAKQLGLEDGGSERNRKQPRCQDGVLDIPIFLLIQQLPDVACCVAHASDVSSFLIFTSVPARRLGYVFLDTFSTGRPV